MLRLLPNSQIDYPQWDACVEASPQAIVYALSWYLDVVSPGWGGVVLEEQGRYLAVMPLPRKVKIGISYLRQPFFAQQLGWFSRQHQVGQAQAALDLVLQQYALVSKYSFNTANQELTFPVSPQLQVEVQHTHHLDLSPPYETLYRQYSRDRKLNLARARKAGLQVVASDDIQPLISLFQSDAASRIRGGAAPESYQILENLFRVLKEKGLAYLYYTRTARGEWDAGCLFVVYAHKIIYLFNAASVAGRRRNGRSLMIDAMIRCHAGQPYVLDFESPAAVAGIIRVYQGFGSVPVPFYTLRYNHLPAPLRWLKQARKLFYQRLLPALRPGSQA
ncbi:MAG: GNAT family N-acetyltransferase [Adhaeribacter sp.]